MSDQIFDEVAWRAVCEKCMKQAMKCTGLSETLFAQNLHGEIAMQLNSLAPALQPHALEIARGFGYVDSAELDTDSHWNAEHGYCAHGIEWNSCPVGCELDESNDQFDDLNVALDESGNEIC